MTAQENKTIVRRLVEEVVNAGDLDRADALIAADCVDHAAPSPQASGPAGFKQGVAMLRAGFPDLRITIEDLIAEEDRVAARLTLRGVHQGQFAGYAPTGRPATWSAMAAWRVAGGKIVERWLIPDAPSLTRQIGQEG
jgi:steroid delta-isomerase-like uncharacterized protein